MLYLAEVQKQKGGTFFGGTPKTELKLLACQRGEQSWTAVPGDEVVPADEATKYAEGSLVLVELTASRQVQRIQEGRQLVGILQNFSRQQEKYKNKEEEIEQWKESLTFQAQELNRREMEVEAREQELSTMENEFEQFDQQRQEIETARQEAERLREEVERNRQELEGAWEHLRGEMRRLEEQQAELPQSSGPVLDEQQAYQLQELLNGLSGAIASAEPLQDHLTYGFEAINAQQSVLNQHWQQLEQQRASAEQMQAEVDRQAGDIQTRWNSWQQAQDALAQARSELKAQQNALTLKQEYAQTLTLHLRNQSDLHQKVQHLAALSTDTKTNQQVDVAALERMSLGELQAIVQNLQQEQEKVKRFVNDQEEELTIQRQTVAELQQKLLTANDNDRQSLKVELTDEQDRYQMLDETLVGQRRTLREREEILTQHVRVLRRRQGIPETDGMDGQKVDLGPVLTQIEASRQQQTEELQKLEQDIEQMRSSIQQAQDAIARQSQEQEQHQQELKQLEQNLQSQRAEAAELWGQVKVYQETLQPIQDRLNELRQQMEAIASIWGHIQGTSDYQHQAIAQMRQIFAALMPDRAHELAAS